METDLKDETSESTAPQVKTTQELMLSFDSPVSVFFFPLNVAPLCAGDPLHLR